MSDNEDLILTTKTLKPELIKVGDPKGNYINVYYPLGNDEFTKLKIQTPKMKIPWDLQEQKNKSGKVFTINVSASTDEIGTDRNKQSIELFRTKLLEIEKNIILKLPLEFKSKEFSSSLRQSNNAAYKPTLKMSIPFKNDKMLVDVFDKNGESLEIDCVKARSLCTFIISLNSIWSTPNKVGINWNIEKIQIFEEIKKGMSLRDDDSDE